MTLEGGLALYAALVGSAALIWQIVVEVRRRRTQVEVRLEEGMKGPRIAVVNRSEHPVRVIAGGLQAKDGSISWGTTNTIIGSQLLGEIPSRDARFVGLMDDDLGLVGVGHALETDVRAWVDLSTGERIESPEASLQHWSKIILDGLHDLGEES